MLCWAPEHRKTAKELLGHQWLKGSELLACLGFSLGTCLGFIVGFTDGGCLYMCVGFGWVWRRGCCCCCICLLLLSVALDGGYH